MTSSMKILIAVKYTLKKLHIDVCMHIHKVLFKKFISLTLEYQIRKFLGKQWQWPWQMHVKTTKPPSLKL